MVNGGDFLMMLHDRCSRWSLTTFFKVALDFLSLEFTTQGFSFITHAHHLKPLQASLEVAASLELQNAGRGGSFWWFPCMDNLWQWPFPIALENHLEMAGTIQPC